MATGFVCLYLSAPSRFFSRKTPEKHGKTVLFPPHRRRVRSCLRSKHKHGTTKKGIWQVVSPFFYLSEAPGATGRAANWNFCLEGPKSPAQPQQPRHHHHQSKAKLPAGFDSTTEPPSTWYDTGAAQGSTKSRGAPLWLNRHVAALTLALHHPEDRSETGGANWHAWLRKDSSHWTFNCFPCLR